MQPFDKYGFRMWEKFVRILSGSVVTQLTKVNLWQRDNIFKLQSIAHNQLSSPRYINKWKYSWFPCSHNLDSNMHPGHFEIPNNFMFIENGVLHCSLSTAT